MFDIEHTPTTTTVALMARVIQRTVTANHNAFGVIKSDITPFHSRSVPPISVLHYLDRVAKFVGLDNDSLIAVLVYLDRVTRAQMHHPSLALSPYNIHRLMLTAIVVAHKFNSDIFFNNLRYSKVGGIPLAEMNQLELEFLFLIKFDLKIDSVDMQNIGDWLMRCDEKQNIPCAQAAGPICTLDQYYEELALAQQAELYKHHYPTPALGPMGSTAAASLSSAATFRTEADDVTPYPAAVAGSAGSAVSHLELAPCSAVMHGSTADLYKHMQHHNQNYNSAAAVTEKPYSRQKTSYHQHHHHKHQQPHHERSPLELTTPSSMTTICPPTTPLLRELPSYEIDSSSAHQADEYPGATSTRSPHVSIAKHPGLHAGGVKVNDTWADSIVLQTPHGGQKIMCGPGFADAVRLQRQTIVPPRPGSALVGAQPRAANGVFSGNTPFQVVDVAVGSSSSVGDDD